jgi:hypothetical protein
MNQTGLQPSDEVRCPTCHHWHSVLFAALQSGHPDSDVMLYFSLSGGEYFAGAQGAQGNLPRRTTARKP